MNDSKQTTQEHSRATWKSLFWGIAFILGFFFLVNVAMSQTRCATIDDMINHPTHSTGEYSFKIIDKPSDIEFFLNNADEKTGGGGWNFKVEDVNSILVLNKKGFSKNLIVTYTGDLQCQTPLHMFYNKTLKLAASETYGPWVQIEKTERNENEKEA